MIKPFILTSVCWAIFILIDSVMDAILFYQKFIWYKKNKLWHQLKYFRIAFSVGTGWFAYQLHLIISGYEYTVYIFLLSWFILFRLIKFETLMERWSGYKKF